MTTTSSERYTENVYAHALEIGRCSFRNSDFFAAREAVQITETFLRTGSAVEALRAAHLNYDSIKDEIKTGTGTPSKFITVCKNFISITEGAR